MAMLKVEPRGREGEEESLTDLEEKRKQTSKETQGLPASHNRHYDHPTTHLLSAMQINLKKIA